MKAFILILAVLTSLSAKAVNTDPSSKDINIGISEVFVPGGFSSTSDAYVVVSGLFPNSCYSWKWAIVTSPTALIHEIKSIASVSQQMCLMVMIPFQKDVNLGRLQSGAHTLRFLNGDGTFFERALKID